MGLAVVVEVGLKVGTVEYSKEGSPACWKRASPTGSYVSPKTSEVGLTPAAVTQELGLGSTTRVPSAQAKA